MCDKVATVVKYVTEQLIFGLAEQFEVLCPYLSRWSYAILGSHTLFQIPLLLFTSDLV